jgi:AcrR family transcriptional regulator
MRFKADKDEATRDRIFDAATTMFAERGIDGVTMRALAERTGANLAAVSYHFGGKENLAVEVFRKVARKSAIYRINALDAVAARATKLGRIPTVREVVSIFVDAYIGMDEPRDGILLSHFVLKHRAAPNAWTNAVVKEELDTMAQRFIELLQRAAPHLSPQEAHWRYHMMVGSTVLTLSDRGPSNRINRLSEGLCSTDETAQMRDALIRFLTSAFSTE